MTTARTDLERALCERFGHEAFRPGQQAVVEAVLRGDDVVAVMPTGGGKSLCYQLPALLLDGITIVVSPLIALMKDQVDALQDLGHEATFVNSTLDASEQRARLRACAAGHFRLLYVAPERLGNARFLESIDEMRVVRLAIDEAHCISSWGHDFRPDYMRLGELRERVGSPPTAAFTATATKDVREDVVRQLRLANPRVFVAGFERPNLRLLVRRPSGAGEKTAMLDRALAEAGTPAIVYCATRKNVESVAAHLRRRGIAAEAYHGGLGAGERERVQDEFMSGASPVIVATNAFGMGVDKSDTRLVLHWDVPGSVEAYYQEAGRAGRDGLPADCVLLYSPADVHIQRFFLEGGNPEPAVLQAILDRLAEGPATATDLAGWVPTRNPMAVDTALGMLRRAGAIVRQPDPLTGDDVYVAGELPPTGELPVDKAYLEAKRRADDERLRAVCGYAAGSTCRRAYILCYFGSDEARDRCDACDRCLGIGRPAARELDETERRAVRIALSGVARVNDRYGRSRIAQFLAGSKSREVVDAALDQLPTYGKLSHVPVRAIGDLLEALADQGLLRRRLLDGPGSGAILALTEEGRRVMRDDPPLSLAIPRIAADAAAAPPAPRRKKRDDDGRAKAALASGGDPRLIERLRAWRLGEALSRKVPAFTILHDSTLFAIAAARPATDADLLAVAGMGPSRLERHGAELLRIVREANGASPPAVETAAAAQPPGPA